MPKAGIDWIGHPIAAPLKCLAGELSRHEHEGYFKERGKQALKAAHDLFPAGVEIVEKLYSDFAFKQDFAFTFAWRGKAYDYKESKRFELGTPATLAFIKDRIEKSKKFYPEDLFELNAQILHKDFKGCHGVYLLQHPENLNEVYIGKTIDLGGERTNNRGGKILVACWSTLPKAEGGMESHLFSEVRHHELLLEKYKDSTGQFHFNRNVNAAPIVISLAEKILHHFNRRA